MLLYNVILTAMGILSEMLSKKCFQKIFSQESVNNLFNPETYILTQGKIYTHTDKKIYCIKEKNYVSFYIACMEINKKMQKVKTGKKWNSKEFSISVLLRINHLASFFFRDIVKTLQTCFFGNFGNAWPYRSKDLSINL